MKNTFQIYNSLHDSYTIFEKSLKFGSSNKISKTAVSAVFIAFIDDLKSIEKYKKIG